MSADASRSGLVRRAVARLRYATRLQRMMARGQSAAAPFYAHPLALGGAGPGGEGMHPRSCHRGCRLWSYHSWGLAGQLDEDPWTKFTLWYRPRWRLVHRGALDRRGALPAAEQWAVRSWLEGSVSPLNSLQACQTSDLDNDGLEDGR